MIKPLAVAVTNMVDCKFIITGDSWSQGEWNGKSTDYKIIHKGFHQYLIDAGHDVTNVGRGGYNNNQSLSALLNELPNNNYTHCFFFFTDPLRQSTYKEFSSQLPSTIIRNHTNVIIKKLDDLSKQTGIKIIIIGGCAKVVISDYNPTNIDLIIPSISELLVPFFVDSGCTFSEEWTRHWLRLKNNCSLDYKHDILNVFDQAQNKVNLWKQRRDLFWPDGEHINRTGHKILFDHVINYINQHQHRYD